MAGRAEVVRPGLEGAQQVELACLRAHHDRRQRPVPWAVCVLAAAYLLQQRERPARRVQPSEYGESGRVRRGEHARVLGGPSQLDAEAVGDELVGDRVAQLAIGLDHQNRSVELRVHQSSTSRGLTPSPLRAIRASTSL